MAFLMVKAANSLKQRFQEQVSTGKRWQDAAFELGVAHDEAWRWIEEFRKDQEAETVILNLRVDEAFSAGLEALVELTRADDERAAVSAANALVNLKVKLLALQARGKDDKTPLLPATTDKPKKSPWFFKPRT